MEINEAILALFLVITLFSGGHSVRRSSVLDCCHHKSICKEDEYCSEDVISYLCKCERSKFRNHKKSYENNLNAQSKKPHRDLTKWNTAAEDTDDRLDQNKHYDEIKYDMTYFENHDSQTETPRESRRIAIKSKEIKDQVLGRAQRQHYNFENFRHRNPSYQIKLRRTIEHKEHSDDTWPPIGIPLPIPRKRTRHYEIMERRDSKFGESKQKKETFQSNELDQKSEDGNALDLDIEIKPLSFSDSSYLEEEKTKLSSIPKKPIGEEEAPQKIEHIQTNIIDKNPAKKAEVGVLIGGRLDQEKANIIHQKSQDQTYDKVKDFFKSQQVSSIVDVPVADKKKSVRFYSLPPEEKDVNVRRSSIPTPSVYPDGVKLDLKERLDANKASDLLDVLQDLLWGSSDRKDAFTSVETEDNTVFFHVLNNTTTKGDKPSTVVERINKDDSLKNALHKAVGVTVLAASLKSKEPEEVKEEDENFMITTFIVAGCVTGILLASVCIFIILRRSQENSRWLPKQVGQEAASDYQSLWRQLRQATWEAPVQTSPVAHVSNEDQKRFFANKDMPPKYSWSEEPVDTKMDISTGHAVLSYMEDHLKNENRLSREWEELSVYEAEPNQTDAGKDPKNSKKNRYTDVLPFDHNRVKLRETSNATGSDYINASYIIDDDPRNAAYIATQGPLGTTVADFWQMVWEQGVVVIVMLTKLADLGLPQCHRYWPEKGHAVYHVYQVHLISEHIWCSDYLVRSFYLKNVQTGETRTVTQFHYLTWPHLGIPASSKPLLDFRRKVHKCYRNLACPVLVHCSGGIDRTGTYILIDMVLSKMSKGTKEIDIAATLEHLRDQRPQMVKTKAQFEFALTSVAEEVNAILQVLTKH